MYPIPKTIFIEKVLVPVLYGSEQKSAIHAAHAIAGDENVLLTGFIYVPKTSRSAQRRLMRVSCGVHSNNFTK